VLAYYAIEGVSQILGGFHIPCWGGARQLGSRLQIGKYLVSELPRPYDRVGVMQG
jgi:hypothetical protein